LCVEDGVDDLGDAIGTCRRTCDTLSEPQFDCNANEVCVPFEACDPNAARCIGFCLPGDGCEPCRAAEICGAESTCGLTAPVTLCLPVGGAQTGDACDNVETFCAAPNVCIAGFCKAPCGGEACGQDDTCLGEGEVCIDVSAEYGDLNIRYCHKACDIYDQTGCGVGEVCTIFDDVGADGAWIGGCSVYDGLVGTATHGEACVENDENYFGSCQPGHVCRNFLDNFGEPFCNGFCDASNQSLCSGASGCVIPFFAGDDLETLGVCAGECEVFGEVGQCGEGRGCDFAFIGARGGEPEVALGQCVEGEESADTGEVCRVDDFTGANDCGPGNICAALEAGAATTCIRLCDTIEGSGHTCDAGFECLTGVFGSADAPSQVVGACVPNP
jgi:hypothetical protein